MKMMHMIGCLAMLLVFQNAQAQEFRTGKVFFKPEKKVEKTGCSRHRRDSLSPCSRLLNRRNQSITA